MKNHSPVPIFVKYLRQLRHSRMAVALVGLYVVAEIMLVAIPGITSSQEFQAYAIFTISCLALLPLLLGSIIATCWYQDRANPGCDPVSTTPLSPLAMMGGLNLVCFAIIAGVLLLSVPALVKLFANLSYGALSEGDFFVALSIGILALITASAALFMFPASNGKGKNISSAMIILVLVFMQPLVIFMISAVGDAPGIHLFLSKGLGCITLWLYAFSISTSQCIPPSGNRRIWPRIMTLAMVAFLFPLIEFLSCDFYGRAGQNLYSEGWAIYSILLLVIDLVTAVNDPVIPSQRILRNHASTPFRRIASFAFAPGAVNGWVFSAVMMMFVSLISFEKSNFGVVHFCFVMLFYAALTILIKDRFVGLNLSGFAVFSIVATIFIMPSFLGAFDVGDWCLYSSPFASDPEAISTCILTLVFAAASAVLIAPPALKLSKAWWGEKN